uniref:Vacuolar membrane protease n=1 Tax=Ananas comosus var. bracteatus TaxID=296719 RepID=A0A6V7QKP2_ANACO|nr:unnamed protein product [Ananas comosus var. bracteatus]
MRDLQPSLNQTQRVRLQSALRQLHSLPSSSSSSSSSPFLPSPSPIPSKGHGTLDCDGEVVATLCGVVERVNKLVYVRALRARYKPEVGDIIVGRVIEIAPKRWRLEINFSQVAVLMLSSMNLPDGIQRRRTAVDELNMRSIFEENDVICAEVRGFQHDGSLHLQARSQKYGKLERGQLLTVPAYLVKRRKQHFHHLEQYGVDLIIGCNGFIWVGEHVEAGENVGMLVEDQKKTLTAEEESWSFTPLETRKHICRIANAIRLLSALGFTLTVEAVVDTAEASLASNIEINDMLGAEFFVQTAEREVQRQASMVRKKGMSKKPEASTSESSAAHDGKFNSNEHDKQPRRSAFLWLALFVILLNGSWAVHHIQFESLPIPLNAEQSGKRGFSEVSAVKHVKYLTSLGPHPVGSDALDIAIQYVFAASEKIKKTAHWEVDVQVELFHATTGANHLVSGLFKGKTLVYSDLKHVVLRIVPKYLPQAEENVILVSSHIDTVFSTEGAGDCSSCVAVMLELARGVSQWAHGFKSGVIFLFNTGEEEGLNGAHSFITQHPWRDTIRFAIDLEAMGIGGKSSIFQGGSAPWALENFAAVSKYPSAQIFAQDLFLSGAIKSATDFQIYQEVAGLPGLDFAYIDATAVYHTKNDKLKFLKPGSLQHLGENMLAFLLHTAMSSKLQKDMELEKGGTDHNQAIYFDVLGMYMVVYSQRLATMLHNSVIFQGLLLWTTSLLMGDGLMEATLSPARSPKKLKVATVILGMAVPVMSSAGVVVRLVGIIVGSIVRLDRNPGNVPDWFGNVGLGVFIALVVCLMFVYILSYIHLSGAKGPLVILTCALLALSLAAVSTGIVPAFTEDIARAVNVVHVVDTTGKYNENQEPSSYISLFSNTPGKLTTELENLKDEEFSCGRNNTLDFVTFTVKYGCWSSKDSKVGWSKSEVPVLQVERDSITDVRETRVLIDTKSSTRWALAINKEEIRDFSIQVDSKELIPVGEKSMVDGWHIIQFSGGKDSPTKFQLNLFWFADATHRSQETDEEGEDPPLLLKLRTDVNRVTPITARVLEKLPPWCSPFGKSTSPHTLAFLAALPSIFRLLVSFYLFVSCNEPCTIN